MRFTYNYQGLRVILTKTALRSPKELPMYRKEGSSYWHYDIEKEDEGRDLRFILRKRLGLYSGTVRGLKQDMGLLLNGNHVTVAATVSEGDVLSVDFTAGEKPADITPEDIPLNIVYSDESFLVIDKPANMVVHPTVFHQTGTLANGLAYYFLKNGMHIPVHLCGRLDLGTSGLVLVALNGYMQEAVRRLQDSGEFTKIYHGIVRTDASPKGSLLVPGYSGKIDAPIARKPGSIMERHVSPDGSPAVTNYRVLKSDPARNIALLEFRLETGRTHQIRVHTSYKGFPLAGDTLYDPEGNRLPDGTFAPETHQLLHAYRIAFPHPITGKIIDVSQEASAFPLSL